MILQVFSNLNDYMRDLTENVVVASALSPLSSLFVVLKTVSPNLSTEILFVEIFMSLVGLSTTK